MALNYPDYVVPQPSPTKLTDLLDLWNQGVAQGKADRYEREAPQQFAQAAAPLSQFGLTMPPDQLRALFANPETRAFAWQQMQEASQRRAEAYDPLRQLQLKQAHYGAAGEPQPAATTALYPPIPAPREARPTPRPRPGIGAIEGGYRFTGGDPSNSANWEKL
jgi:hypothetical protein